MSRKAKISDVARLSGVSVSTVSLVLNQRPGISQETRERVLKAVEELGYVSRSSSTRGQNSHPATVGMLVKTDPDIPPQANPFYSKVMAGIEDACRRQGINLLFATLPVDENNRPLETPQMLYQDFVQGLLLVGISLEAPFLLPPGRNSPPIVLVDGYSSSGNYDTVVSDNFRAAYRAVEYLLQLGHRQIGLVGGQAGGFPSLTERRNGYLRALKENGIARSSLADFNINRSKGYQETLDLLEANPEITALFCVNDDAASAAIRAAQSLGRRVPQDLSVVGYDDTYIAANTNPALTTQHVDTVTMGRAAVHLLSLRLDNPDAARMTLTVHPWLVERDSTAGLPQSPQP